MDPFRVIVFIPVKNAAESIEKTLCSLQQQTRLPDGIIVGDHQSTDRTPEIAKKMGVTVVECTSPIPRKGANLQTIYQSLEFKELVRGYSPENVIIIVIDGDTIVHPQGIENLISPFKNQEVVGASGYVIPAELRSIWQLARLAEYHLSLNLHKRIQSGFGTSLVCSGCFSAIRLNVLIESGGFGVDSLSEDLVLTWEQLVRGRKVCFVPDAICYTAEPWNCKMLCRQLDRWQRGFFEAVEKFKREILSFSNSTFSVFVLFWLIEVFISPVLPMITLWATLQFGLDFLRVAIFFVLISELVLTVIPALIGALKHRHLLKTICGLPWFYLLRIISVFTWWRSLWRQWVMKEAVGWNKGH
jgi:cellulose synthase/poly-beta-1,6-N-acetylglucosamine synthase-like glycosyltransferase